MIERFLKQFERYIVIGLLAMMVVAVFLGSLELAFVLVKQILKEPVLILNLRELLEIFGFFLMILIGLELIETIHVYLRDDVVHVEIIFLVAIIAVARKIIILDVQTIDPITLIGIASVISALSVGYFLLKKVLNRDP